MEWYMHLNTQVIEEVAVERTLQIALDFCNRFGNIVYCLEEDVFYMHVDGVYVKMHEREIQNFILDKASFTRKQNLNILKQIIERIKNLKQVKIASFNPDGFVNFKNGLFYFDICRMYPHNETVLSTIRIPYKYDENATCPLWEKSLSEILQNDKNKIRTIQEFFGYCLTREVKYEKALVLTGEGANGKSTILNTLKHMVGLDNCSALSLKYFSDPQKTSLLKGKLVNICTEVPKKIDNYESEFKAIVTGEDIQVSPKYVADFTISPYCKVVLALNEFPYIDDKTSAFYRRLLIVDLHKQFSEEEQNKDLREQLLGELPGIFNWALQGWIDLKTRNQFIIDEYMKKEIERIQIANNPIIEWSRDHVMVLHKGEIEKSEAYENYTKWCERNGYRAFGCSKFSAEFYRLFQKNTDKAVRQSYGHRNWIWPNLAWRTPENELRAQQKIDEVKEIDDWKE